MPQTTIISFFKYKGIRNKWQALGRMGRPPLLNKSIQGLHFWKTFGSGSGNGFSIFPDFSTFGLLSVFNSEKEANAFLNSEVMMAYTQDCLSHSHVLMHTIKASGKWSGIAPFVATADWDPNKPIAIITRATIKPRLAL